MSQPVVVITGASRGLGAAAALSVATAGAHPVLVARDEDALAGVAVTIADNGGTCTVRACDVANREAMDVVVDRVVAEHGRLDVFVNNAGVAPQARVEQMSDEDWNAVLELNLTAVFRSARALAPVFKAAGSGRLINVTSVFGQRGR